MRRFLKATRAGPPARLIISLLLASCSISGSLARHPASPRNETVSLPQPLEILERSFRAGNPDTLRTLLQGPAKIQVASPALGLKPGYYSCDQVYFLFQDVFRFRKTLKFQFLKGADSPPDAQRLRTVARWTYRKGDSRDLTAELSFDLVLREGVWRIQEIRELL